MKLEFADNLPENLISQAVCISGRKSYYLNHTKYVLVKENDIYTRAFEIKYEFHCSPFEQAEIYQDILAVGFEGHFYLFNINKNKSILILAMEGYFGHFYENNNHLYVADAGTLCCITLEGIIIWHNKNLAIDGVIVDRFEQGKIFGSGEWDPPGGWRDFIIDNLTGVALR